MVFFVVIGVIVLYVLVNVVYFVVILKVELVKFEVIVVGFFFCNMFGESVVVRSLLVFVVLSNIGNVFVVSFVYFCVN